MMNLAEKQSSANHGRAQQGFPMQSTLQCTAVALAMAIHMTAFGQGSWHFESDGGLPVKLVWQVQPGQTCTLRESADLRSWVTATGFPKVATGTVMEHAFVPGAQCFFQISSSATGGGWQTTGLPALPADSTYKFYAVSALNSNHVWVSGNISPGSDACVLRSGDGGAAWSLIYRAAEVGWMWRELQMISPEVGYVAGTGIYHTADGGTTWQVEQGNQPNPPGTWHSVVPDGYVYGMSVVDADHVWIAGYDGATAGVIWHRVPERPQPNPVNIWTPWWLEWAVTGHGMYGISAVNQTTAWAVGYAGYIWKTTDGQGWGQQTSPTGVPLGDVAAMDTNTVWAVGDGGTILKTTNGGAIWTPQVSGTTENLQRIAAVNTNVAWAVGAYGVILHTSDGGTTWTRQFSGTTATLHGVAAADTNTAWIVGEHNTILRTTDGGHGNWPPPTISRVTPNVAGEDSSWPMPTMTVTGAGFRGGNVSASYGGTPARSVTWVNESTLLVTPDWGPVGTVDLTVVNEDGQSATLPRAVTFVPRPVIKSYSPFHGPAAGGYQITVDGFNLQTVNRAEFYYINGGDPQTLGISVIDSTRVVVTVPESASRPPGKAVLALNTAQNQSFGAQDFLLDDAGGPTFAVDSITPASGPANTTVTITGVGFTTNTTLELCGGFPAITSRSSTQLVTRVSGDFGVGDLQVINSESDGVSVYPAFLLTSGAAPTISQVDPASAPSAGGTSVTIAGTGFLSTETVTVTFDGYSADVTSRTDTSMVVTIPPHAPGVVSVFVMSENLQRGAAELPAAFTYH